MIQKHPLNWLKPIRSRQTSIMTYPMKILQNLRQSTSNPKTNPRKTLFKWSTVIGKFYSFIRHEYVKFRLCVKKENKFFPFFSDTVRFWTYYNIYYFNNMIGRIIVTMEFM